MTSAAYCDTRERLSVDYALHLGIRSRAEDNLRSRGEVASASDYQKLKALANESRIDSEMARLELERHVEQHGCGHRVN